MSTIVKMPISNVLLGSDYTGEILVGASLKKMNVILDTGSSTLAVNGQDFPFDPPPLRIRPGHVTEQVPLTAGLGVQQQRQVAGDQAAIAG